MSEKRKPEYTILLRKRGIKQGFKIELFPEYLWTKRRRLKRKFRYGDRFRIRFNGKWFPLDRDNPIFITKTKIKELVFRNIGDTWIKFRKEKR